MVETDEFVDYWQPPTWLNDKFIEEILQKYKNDNTLEVKSMNIKPAVAKGEHYASCMYRMNVSYLNQSLAQQLQSTSIICKTTNLDEYASNTLEEYNIYKQEMIMYSKVLPDIHRILKRATIVTELSPRPVHIDFSQNSIIFEDLNVKGFTMAPRTDGLDRAHTKIVLKKLALYHAASVVYNEAHNKELETFFNLGMFNRQVTSDGINLFFLSNLKYLADEVMEWAGWEYYAKKLYNLRDRLIENGKQVFDAIPGDFNVLVHGDLWVNNVMFKYDEHGKPIDGIMVDFQMPKWGSPAIDILYFMATSLADELREHNQDEFILYYHKSLIMTLQKLGYRGPIPKLHELQCQFLKKYFYSFTSTCLVLPIMKSEHSGGAADFRTLMGKDEYSKIFKKNIYKSAKVQVILKKFLPYFDKKGILDL